MQNYFELFDLETSFFISDSNLKDSYRREIARFHPDKFASKTDSEKLQALQNTSLLNTAFEMIKSPLNRASYLLKLDGVDPFDEKDTAMDHDFLISQIELREELEVIESKTDTGKLDDFIDRIESHVQSKVESISNAFKDTSDTLEIKKDVRELKFYEQLAKESNKLMDEWL
ncbi:MAG: Fe-S protein assembly co-chaperone HscB [Thiotrichales bacterium]|jgi:molecular chaperone HscB|nr:Fe-S protein assembly co-chaperone HscB [Thiotrichales bacterium]MBT4653760.1 Fe-S protein assembly co-chaperone HscB [Thiotrichales bacterium]MBT5500012.1 Fe-S protein assembly co-chaperone HscB [Thiotrichales bacterium]MBT5984341.1 Fe-S protein assembly co-chaperone HscB [Thiotrichales bacterium]MBT6772088.1 Fe-S protein assembly co-chaperone HscB [Thiotrichales bacterium]